jgi:two-component sensor histidine kinase/CheY-like chemotaxis protein
MSDAAGARLARILYVDDDAVLVRLVQKSLGRRGFVVKHAESGPAAIEAVISSGADAVVLDHYLPTGTGLEVLQKLSVLEGAPPVVYVTGSTETAVAVAALKAGAADFVPKAVGNDFIELLIAALRQALAKHRLEEEKRGAERQIRIARDRAEAMLQEVNHRVANSLALVAGLIGLQVRAAKDPAVRDALIEAQSRISAVGYVHKRLYSSGDVGVVDLKEYLSGLLEQLASAMKVQGLGGDLVHSLTPALLRTDTSINLGVIVTEWVTNAYKYAYPAGGGQVQVNLKRLSERRLRLTVVDDGIGFEPGDLPKGTGLGSRIVASMARAMNAEVNRRGRTPGSEFSIDFDEDGQAFVPDTTRDQEVAPPE